MTVTTANTAAFELIGLDVEPVGSNILAFATDPDVVGAPLRMVAEKTILGYEATVSLRHVEGGVVEVLARVVAVPEHDDVAIAVGVANEVSASADDAPGALRRWSLAPLFAGMLDDERPWADLADGAEMLRVVADRLASVPHPFAPPLPWAEHLTSRQWEIVGRLLSGDRVPAIAEALFLSQSTVRNHLHAVFEKAGVRSQGELIALIRRGSDRPISPN